MGGSSKKSVPETPTEKTFLVDPIVHYRSRTGRYPSNAQMWWLYKRPLEIGTDEPPKSYLEVFDPGMHYQLTIGNAPAPKGHYILQEFHADRSAVSGVQGLEVRSAGSYRPQAVAFHAGRVFYAGTNVAGFNTKIYFSQILERASQVQECFQANDPTDEDLRDLLPSDGGVIVCPEVSEVYHMHSQGQSLFVFARNGVWQITGSEGIGFRANDYSVNKISGVPAISNMSFVDVEGVPIWWNKTGIYTLVLDQVGTASVKSLSEDTIKTFYDKIPGENKKYAKGAYDALNQRVQWLYKDTEAEDDDDQYIYDRILNLDTRTGAFYPYTPAQTRTKFRGIFAVEGYQMEHIVDLVYVNDDLVLVESETVGNESLIRKPVQSKITYVVDVLDETTVSQPTPPDFPVPEPVLEDVYSITEQVFVGSNEVQSPL